MSLTEDFIRRIPKVLLHDHLDGGVRPQTVIELAKAQKYDKLPTDDPKELMDWFHRGAQRGSLPMYLEGFEHTCGVMQTAEALERVAYETLEDMLHDGVYYVETRFAPLLHIQGGLTIEEVVSSVLRGLERGKVDFGVHYGVILVALRNMAPDASMKIADLSVKYRNQGVVGFDLAAAEKGFPANDHIEAFRFITQSHFNTTIHAGEGFGVESIRQAVIDCGAHRIGHGTRITEDMKLDEQGKVIALGPLAQYVLDRRIPLEMCLTSNVHTGTVPSIAQHPFKMLHDLDYRVTLNTDDRLMSGITLTDEYLIAHREFGLTAAQLYKITINGMKSSFQSLPYKKRFITEVLEPRYLALLAESGIQGQGLAPGQAQVWKQMHPVQLQVPGLSAPVSPVTPVGQEQQPQDTAQLGTKLDSPLKE